MKTLLPPPPAPPVRESSREDSRRWRWAGYLGIALFLGSAGLCAEYWLQDTLLLRPAYRWRTQALPGATLAGPGGGYSLDFQGTRLDWRLERRGAGRGVDYELIGYPGLRLSVSRRSEPGPELAAPDPPETIPAPNAWGARLVVTEAHQVLGAFPIGREFLLLRFESLPPPTGRETDTDVLMGDIRSIAASVRPSPRILPSP